MIKCEVIQEFTLGKFDELKNLQRKTSKNTHGYLYVGDVFECTKELADYLLGENKLQKAFVKVLEITLEIKEDSKIEEKKVEKKTTKRKKTK